MPGWGDVSGSVLLGWHEKVRGVFELTLHPSLTDGIHDSSLLRSPELDV